MNKFFFLLPYVLSFAISIGVLVYTLRFRGVRGASAYAWYVAGQSLWVFGYIFELISPSLGGKIFWDKSQWVAGIFLAIAFPVFAIQYTDIKISQPRLLFTLSLIIPSSLLILLVTDSQHHLLYPNPYLDHTYIFSDLKYDFTWVVYAYAIYSYLVTFTGLGILIRRLIRPHRLYRRQISTVAVGFFIPIFFTMLTTAGVKFMPFRDVSPITFAFGNLIVAWGLFRYHLFDIIPIARDIVVENMEDLVVVLDMQERVVDMNSAALEALGMESPQVIGQPAEMIFNAWPELMERFYKPESIKTEISLSSSVEPVHYEIKSTVLHDKNKRYIGRVFVSRDITERVNLQKRLEKLNKGLEDRVRERTEELRKSAERYRAVVESQTEFIVRWRLDGTRTFVNDAYRNYFGITSEQDTSTSFIPLVAEEDRHAVNGKIARLMSGEVDAETDIHRVIKPDGSIGWQEWTDRVIRDESGKVVEFQSVGRDISKRKLAEEALRESETIYRQAIEVAGAVPYRQSYPGNGIKVNYDFIGEGIRQITGYGPEEFNDAVWDLLVQESHQLGELAKYSWREAVQRVRTGTSQIWQCEHRIRARDGKIRWVYEAAVELRDKDGNSHGSIGLYQDITERKQVEEELRKLSHAVEQSNTSIVITDLDGIIEYVNPYFSELTGYTLEEAVGQNLRILQSGITDEAVYEDLWETITDGKEWRGEFCNKKKNDELYWESASISPILDSSGKITHFVAVKTDITARKQAEQDLIEAYDTTLEGWAKALELRDKETEDHSRRVTELTVILAQAMGLQGEALVHIRRGAILHDIGKMAIPDEILRKRGPLTDAERKVIEQHPLRSYELLSPISFLEKALEIPYCHHEHWDGGGYPRGLKGEDIPLSARIFSVIDVWDALLSDRPYSKAWPKEKTIRYLKEQAGKYFDPGIVEVFLNLVDQGAI